MTWVHDLIVLAVLAAFWRPIWRLLGKACDNAEIEKLLEGLPSDRERRLQGIGRKPMTLSRRHYK